MRGVESLHGFHPDVVILDVNIGEHDGRAICRMIKHDDTLKKTLAILISGDNLMLRITATVVQTVSFKNLSSLRNSY